MKNPDYTQHPQVGYQSVSDGWKLVNAVRKIEFKLLQIIPIQLARGLPPSF